MTAAARRPPNFLFIITDQQRADHLGAYGNPIVRTPHIDALARAGFRAARFYVAMPICMPNRATLMTGRMPSAHGVRHNGIELSLDATTSVDVLRQAGYRTALVGKGHLQNITSAPAQWPPDPADRLPREAHRRGPGRYGQELQSTWEKDPSHELELPYYGFETVDLSIRHADQQYGHWRRWLRSRIADADSLIGPDNAIPTPEFELTKCRQAWRTRVPEELYPTTWITERTLATLRDCAAAGRPFFVQCSYPDPHHPFTPPGRYWSMYPPEDMPRPPSFAAAHRDLPPHVGWLHAQRDTGRAVDFAPTVLARAGVRGYNGIQGQSLLPIMDGSADSVRDALLIEEEGQRTYLGFAGRVRMRSLVTDRHRLSIYDGVPWGELYDFEDDPHETVNLWNVPDAAKLRAELTERLARTMLVNADTSPYPTALA
jgi:arylsulfatase A-like enzyme